MRQQNALELAKQGNSQAIAALLNRNLQPHGITARVALRNNGALQILLEAESAPNLDKMIPFIQQGMNKLQPVGVQSITVFGREAGAELPNWSREVSLGSWVMPSRNASLEIDDLLHGALCKLRLDCGHEIILERLDQRWTYGGVLAGVPNRVTNDHAIQWALREACKLGISERQPYLVEPHRTPYCCEEPVSKRIREGEFLPPILCMGEFMSRAPVRKMTMDLSHLTVVWYQDHFGTGNDMVATLRSLNWPEVAYDGAY